MKIAINVSHGSFGLSPEAIKLYCKKSGIPCYFFNIDFSKKEDKYTSILVPTDSPTGALRWRAFTVQNPSEQKDPYKFLIDDNFKDDQRSNRFLIETIEELGEKANGSFSKLKIVDVPDDVKWHIAEYDGWEWIAENHRIWE